MFRERREVFQFHPWLKALSRRAGIAICPVAQIALCEAVASFQFPRGRTESPTVQREFQEPLSEKCAILFSRARNWQTRYSSIACTSEAYSGGRLARARNSNNDCDYRRWPSGPRSWPSTSRVRLAHYIRSYAV